MGLFDHANKRNDAFETTTVLAAIDHKCHLHRKPFLTKDGELKYNKVFSKRLNNWRISIVKEEKGYDYWDAITCNVLQKRKDDKGSILRGVPVPADDPKNIAPSIALKP